ncbi:MAG: tRNA (adenosine(37)-N6)-dimethylallyltransferase MiaA, partial [Betaproteobacteria bacterium]|nr:tRNA (adenosine(37)-N6)-dimethylallyltransferase MiaA [Betaproteobacteria bacterium]MDH4325934.1 tRNA (adenosine(37)-N6)-dimethylallyltransferase MiaA [Betaproteobacteria bacterium]MDH5579417.1 tRNA (adenosine(37)-N6)-dimethylallyltransferase MiaA [Betaproteobacteria bacterium]
MAGKAYALLGPTASGKSRLALELAARHPVEIVSMDSGQVYRDMDIGTAKPSREERVRVPHHLVDLIDPTERYSAGRFRADCVGAIEEIQRRGRIPLIVGGTMLYYKALTQGLDALPEAEPGLRVQIDARAARHGWPALHAELARVDPATAARLSPNDAQRIQRALEVWELTGRPISELQTAAKPDLPFQLKAYALVPEDRAELHRRIAARFARMLAEGLVEEVEGLRRRYALHANLPSMRCVGYRQVWSYLEGEYGRDELRDRAVAATRQLAKRQLTWLRSLPGIEPASALALE